MNGFELRRMTAADAPLTVDWRVAQYGFDRAEVEQWVATLAFDWPLSVKAVGADGRVAGLLNMSSYRIEDEAEQMPVREPELLARLNALRYTAVFSFIVRADLRGTRLNHDMLTSIMPELRRRFDFVFVPVLHRLATHRYWRRWGALEFHRDAECVYYALPLGESQRLAISEIISNFAPALRNATEPQPQSKQATE